MTVTNAPVAKLTSPGDVVSMIPYVLGFIPEHSLVLGRTRRTPRNGSVR